MGSSFSRKRVSQCSHWRASAYVGGLNLLTWYGIYHQVGVGHATVQRWLATGAFPEKKPREQASRVDPYLPYILERWAQGCHNLVRIHQELVARGYKGSYASVRDNIIRLLPDGREFPKAESSEKLVPMLSRQATFLFLRQPEE
jgi:hypothetical protein